MNNWKNIVESIEEILPDTWYKNETVLRRVELLVEKWNNAVFVVRAMEGVISDLEELYLSDNEEIQDSLDDKFVKKVSDIVKKYRRVDEHSTNFYKIEITDGSNPERYRYLRADGFQYKEYSDRIEFYRYVEDKVSKKEETVASYPASNVLIELENGRNYY